MYSQLYKFIADPTALRFLLKGAVRITPISELNDPSELSPSLSVGAVQASLARLRRDGYSERDLIHLRRQEHVLRHLAPRFLVVQVPRSPDDATRIIRSHFYDSVATLERLLNDAAREISSKVGLFCLSLRYDSLPMWAHYARNAAGLVIEFRDLEKVFSGDETGVLWQPVAVRYARERSGMTFEPQSHESLFFEKFQDWSYEQEVRVVVPLADCRLESLGSKSVYLYDIPSERIARVILGWNMSAEDVDGSRKLVSELNPAVGVLHARFVRGRVELEDGSNAL